MTMFLQLEADSILADHLFEVLRFLVRLIRSAFHSHFTTLYQCQTKIRNTYLY